MSETESPLQAMRASVVRLGRLIPGMPVLDTQLVRTLMFAGEQASTRLEQALRPHGLSESDFRTLVALFSCEDGQAFPSELCLFAVQKPTNMTRIADGLVASGLATRSHSTRDRRRILIRITPAGKKLVTQLLPQLHQQIDQALAILDATEKRQLDAILMKLLEHLEGAADKPGDAS